MTATFPSSSGKGLLPRLDVEVRGAAEHRLDRLAAQDVAQRAALDRLGEHRQRGVVRDEEMRDIARGVGKAEGVEAGPEHAAADQLLLQDGLEQERVVPGGG